MTCRWKSIGAENGVIGRRGEIERGAIVEIFNPSNKRKYCYAKIKQVVHNGKSESIGTVDYDTVFFNSIKKAKEFARSVQDQFGPMKYSVEEYYSEGSYLLRWSN